MSLRRKLGTFKSYGFAQQAKIAEALLLLAVARIAVLLIPFARIARWMEYRSSSRHFPKTPEPALVYSIRRAVKTASRNATWKSVCMQQSLAMYAMLARRGYDSTFRMGAKIDPQGGLQAHAWLEVGGRTVIGEDGLPGIAPLARFGEKTPKHDSPKVIR